MINKWLGVLQMLVTSSVASKGVLNELTIILDGDNRRFKLN